MPPLPRSDEGPATPRSINDAPLQLKFVVPNAVAGAVLGRGGATVSRIKAATGCYVQVRRAPGIRAGRLPSTTLLCGRPLPCSASSAAGSLAADSKQAPPPTSFALRQITRAGTAVPDARERMLILAGEEPAALKEALRLVMAAIEAEGQVDRLRWLRRHPGRVFLQQVRGAGGAGVPGGGVPGAGRTGRRPPE